MKKDPLAHAPILPLLRALGRHGVGGEKATEHVVSLSAAKADWCPGSASRSAVRVAIVVAGTAPAVGHPRRPSGLVNSHSPPAPGNTPVRITAE